MNETTNPGELLVPGYQVSLVLLSYLLAVFGSFIAFTAAQRIRSGEQGFSLFNLLAASMALGGIGVWSMHFTGILALKLGMATGYSMPETIASLLAAIGATAGALAYVAKAPESNRRVLVTGSLLGLGVAVVHYLGMFGIRFPGFIIWSWKLIALSVVIAMVAASAALWLAFRTRSAGWRFVAALVMGVAVCSMHYTGVAAADFVCTASPTERFASMRGFMVIGARQLPFLTSILALGMCLMIAYEQWLQRKIEKRAR